MRARRIVTGTLIAGTLALGATLAQTPPPVQSVTLVDGRPDVFEPQALVANLDAGDLVAGSSRFDHDGDGVIFNETRVGFLWTPAAGMEMFDVTDELYFTPHFQTPVGVAGDGTVAGTVIFRTTFESRPFRNTAAGMFEFLPLPAEGWIGSAAAVSEDGRVIAGTVQAGVFGAPPPVAALWNDGVLELLPGGGEPSRALGLSADGRVVVGSVGPTEDEAQPARWVDGVLERLRPAGASGFAQFASADGALALGVGVSRQGRHVLARWDAGGRLTRFRLPRGFTQVAELRDVNPDLTAAVGALSDGANQAPFLWTLDGGFVVLDELGREDDYDLSVATGVSDDGSTVIGELRASVVFNGDPPQTAFLWRADLGTTSLDAVLEASGFPPAGLFAARAVSGDGTRILADGLPERTPNDTNSVILVLAP